MITRMFYGLCVLVLVFSYATFGQAQDHSHTNKEMKKTEMPKSAAEMGSLKTVSCGSPCDFSISSRDENELISVVKTHAKTHHNMDVTDKQVKEEIKIEKSSSSKKDSKEDPKKD